MDAQTLEQLIGQVGRGFFGGSVFDEFDALHQTHAAHVTNDRVFLLEHFQARAEVLADGLGVVHQVLFFDQIDGGLGCYARHRVATERRNGQALVGVGNFRARQREPDGHAVSHALGAGDDVRFHFPVLDPPPLPAGATPGRLHFVGDEQAPIVAHDVGYNLEIAGGRHDESPQTLNRLRQQAGDLATGGGFDDFIHIICAVQIAAWVGEPVGAAVAIRPWRMHDPERNHACLTPRVQPRERLGKL